MALSSVECITYSIILFRANNILIMFIFISDYKYYTTKKWLHQDLRL
jgi:hypothetical protein